MTTSTYGLGGLGGAGSREDLFGEEADTAPAAIYEEAAERLTFGAKLPPGTKHTLAAMRPRQESPIPAAQRDLAAA